MYHLTLTYAVKTQLLYSLALTRFMFTGNSCILRSIQQGPHSYHMLKLQVEAFISLNPSLPFATLEL